jgi:hypothetical protein
VRLSRCFPSTRSREAADLARGGRTDGPIAQHNSAPNHRPTMPHRGKRFKPASQRVPIPIVPTGLNPRADEIELFSKRCDSESRDTEAPFFRPAVANPQRQAFMHLQNSNAPVQGPGERASDGRKASDMSHRVGDRQHQPALRLNRTVSPRENGGKPLRQWMRDPPIDAVERAATT